MQRHRLEAGSLMSTAQGTAVLSSDDQYRYRLTRTWAAASPVTFVMLNPSTADASADDPTIRRCICQLLRGLATWDGQRTLQTLKQQLSDGLVQMKVFTEKPLHGKTYIFHAPQKKHTISMLAPRC